MKKGGRRSVHVIGPESGSEKRSDSRRDATVGRTRSGGGKRKG